MPTYHVTMPATVGRDLYPFLNDASLRENLVRANDRVVTSRSSVTENNSMVSLDVEERHLHALIAGLVEALRALSTRPAAFLSSSDDLQQQIQQLRNMATPELHYLPGGMYVRWTNGKGKEIVGRIIGVHPHDSGWYSVRTVVDKTRCTKHKDDLEPLATGVPVERIASVDGLRKVLTAVGFPADGHEPDEADITAEVYGFSLDNSGNWPMENNTHIGVKEPSAGCPRPVPHPAHTEMYVRIRKGRQSVADVNLSTLLAWAAYGPRPPARPSSVTHEVLSRAHRALNRQIMDSLGNQPTGHHDSGARTPASGPEAAPAVTSFAETATLYALLNEDRPEAQRLVDQMLPREQATFVEILRDLLAMIGVRCEKCGTPVSPASTSAPEESNPTHLCQECSESAHGREE